MAQKLRIGLISDLHVKHWINRFQDAERVILGRIVNSIDEQSGVDVLVNCGDTESPSIDAALENEMVSRGALYRHVSGNHDYYFKKNVNLDSMYSEVFSEEIKERSFVFGTLWTNFNDEVQSFVAAQQWINDFRLIENKGRKFSDSDSVNLFDRTKKFIETAKRDVVCTHFGCHPLSIHPRYDGDALNNYFVPNMTETMKKCKVKLWLHGHVHDAFDYVTESGVRVVTNPLGYPREAYDKIEDYSVKIVTLT